MIMRKLKTLERRDGRVFQKAPRGRRIIGSQTLSVCRIRRATLSESVKIQNQKLPLARETLRWFSHTKRTRAALPRPKAQRVTEPCAEADVGGEPPSTTTRVPTLTRP